MRISKRMLKYTGLILLALVVLILVGQNQGSRTFDEGLLQPERIYEHIEELSSRSYQGRLAGSSGNEAAIAYVESEFMKYGIEPAGDDGGYLQNFRTIMPDIDSAPEFQVMLEGGLRDLKMYEDYKLLPSGEPADFSGEMILVGSNLLRVDPTLLADRLVVIDGNRLKADHVAYVKEQGGAGILICTDREIYSGQQLNEMEKSLALNGKSGDSIIVGYLGRDVYLAMLETLEKSEVSSQDRYLGILGDVRLKVTMDFPVVETANVLGKIEGKDPDAQVVFITANLDGAGMGTGEEYFPGAMSTASGLSTMLELARVMAAQENKPYSTVVFIAFNAQMQQYAGVKYYMDHPLYDMAKTDVIHLGPIGKSGMDGLKVSSDLFDGAMLRNRIADFAVDAGLNVSESRPLGSTVDLFTNRSRSAILLTDDMEVLNSYEDKVDGIEMASLENAAQVLVQFVRRDIYRDTAIDYLTARDKAILAILFLGFLVNMALGSLYKRRPNMRIRSHSIEQVYYSSAGTFIRRVYAVLIPIATAVFALVFLAHISPDTNILFNKEGSISNFSGYLNLKHSLLYIKGLLQMQGAAKRLADIWEVIAVASMRSMKLLSASLLLSCVAGIGRGVYSAYDARRNNVRSLGTLMLFSVPDVLVVLLGMLAYVFIAKNLPWLNKMLAPREFLLPLITLSILPGIYIARITGITIQEEMKKDYIENAQAKGLSKRRIFLTEMMPAVVFKIVDSLPGIMTMLLSNMIIVEYLFNYIGIVYYLLFFYKRMDIDGFVAIALTLGAIYLLYTMGLRRIARAINPLKREVEK